MHFYVRVSLLLSHGFPGDKSLHLILKHGGKIIGGQVFCERIALGNDAVHAGITHKQAFFCLFLFKFQDLVKISGHGGEKCKVILDIIRGAESIFRQKYRKLGLDAEIGAQRFLQHIIIFYGKLCVKVKLQDVVGDTVVFGQLFVGELFQVFLVLLHGIIAVL